MGMHDESWCDACGTSLPYSEDDVTCGSCEKEFAIDFIESFLNYLSKYVKDLIKVSKEATDDNVSLNDDEYFESDEYYRGAIESGREILLELEDRYRNA